MLSVTTVVAILSTTIAQYGCDGFDHHGPIYAPGYHGYGPRGFGRPGFSHPGGFGPHGGFAPYKGFGPHRGYGFRDPFRPHGEFGHGLDGFRGGTSDGYRR